MFLETSFSNRTASQLALCSYRITAAILFFLAGGLHCHALPSLDPLFGDHMVLQREKPVRISGNAQPGEQISVSIDTQSATTRTGTDGRWTVILDSMKAGGPFDLTVQGESTIVIHDVLVGEVWLASGQSNMDYELKRSADAANELRRSEIPLVRFLKLPQGILSHTADNHSGKMDDLHLYLCE